MNQQQLIEQIAKAEYPLFNHPQSDERVEVARRAFIAGASWMQGEWERLREDRNNWVAMYQNACKLVRLAHDATERTQKACNRQTFQLAAKENELRKLKKEMAALKRAICYAGVNKQVDFHLPKPQT